MNTRARHLWLERGRELAKNETTFQMSIAHRQFEIGDWLTVGVNKWKRDAYTEAAAIFTGYTKVTLRDLAFVARSVETSSRNDVLSWAHHKVVAHFSETPELQKQLLTQAADQGMSVSTLRKHIAESHPSAKHSPKTERSIKLTLPSETLADVERLAVLWGDEPEGAALKLIEYALRLGDIRQQLDAAA